MTTYKIAHNIKFSQSLSCRLVRHPSCLLGIAKKDSRSESPRRVAPTRQAGMTQHAQ